MRKNLMFTLSMMLPLSMMHATIWYVHPDSMLNSIQAGVDSSADGDTVLVGAGTYIENINFLGKAILVKSEHGPDTTIIDGSNAPNPDSGSVVVFISGEDSNSVLDGFTLTNGSGTGAHDEAFGGGITCHNNSSPMITGNTIIGNTADLGGGIYCWNSAPTITNNMVLNNAGGGIVTFESSPIISGNTVTGNSSVAMYFMASQSTITQNIIEGNTGDAIICDTWFGNITNNTIAANIGGGIVAFFCAGTINYNTIIDNTGGGISCHDCYDSISISNNTITRNGGGIHLCHSESNITNNDIIDNAGNGIDCGGYEATITGNTISENAGGLVFGCALGGCYATVENNVITRNRGRGITAHGCPECGVGVHVRDNTIAENTRGGIYCDCNRLGMSIIENIITRNTAEYGGGICVQFERWSYQSGMVISNNFIDGNTANEGGGIWFSIAAEFEEFHSTVDHNTISSNTATRGGGVSISERGAFLSIIELVNNVTTGNTAEYGAGISCSDSTDANISYCTIAANNGDGIYCDSSANPIVNFNNIIDNTGYGVRNADPNVIVDATHNWWGDASGPGGMGTGTGDEVSAWVDYTNWFTRPVRLRDVVDFEPNTFNKKRHGKWVTVYIELKDPYIPANIDLTTVRLKGNLPGEVSAEPKPTCIGDYDNDGIPDRMVKFNSDLVNAVLAVGDSVKVTIKGKANDYQFTIDDYIEVIEPGGAQSVGSEDITALGLEAVYPNPFAGNAAIRFSIPHSTNVTLQVFDTSGRLVRTLIDGEKDVGSNAATWDGRDDQNRKLPSGVYFLRFRAGNFASTEKVVLLR